MKKLWLVLLATGMSACSDGGGSSVGALAPGLADGPGAGGGGTGECSIEGQKQFVLDAMNFWYFWNDRLPSDVNLDDFATPQQLLTFLSSFSPGGPGDPVDRFSFLTTAAADQAFFGEGEFEGYGFGSRFESADDLRITRVFANSPADQAGFERGQQIIALNGRSIADVEATEGFNAVLANPPVEFRLQPLVGDAFDVTVNTATVTIDPVPQYRIIDNNGTPTGYIELETFISTADARLDAAFADFVGAGVTDVILDLRYNGGGLVNTAELLGDLLGGSIYQGLVFSETRFNADRSDQNFSELFETRPGSLSLIRLAIIASQNTASASELVTNSLDVANADVVIIGDRTFGKPVGQIGLEFCDLLLRPTAFQTVNGEGFGDYFNGLPADFEVEDDLATAVGANDDPNVVAALNYFATGSFPASGPSDGPAAAARKFVRPETGSGSTPARVYAGAR